METPGAYIPTDRRRALARGEALPDRAQGSALFADISGFTPLTEALARELGPQRGAEEISRHLNLVYDALIDELDRYSGSVTGFSGDAITCWFDGDSGLRATACALAMQQAMSRFATVTLPSGDCIALAMKAAVATGTVRRFLVGDPQIQLIDVLAGAILDHLAAAEHHAQKGEVVLDPAAAASLGDAAQVAAWRDDGDSGQRFGVLGGLTQPVEPSPWPPLPSDALGDDQVRPWLLPSIYERLRSGQGEFLAELRPAVALFMRFAGIDYDADPQAHAKLDGFIRRVQHILARYDGTLLQLTIGDKGSYLYAAFGAPLAHEDDAVRAASAALELGALPATLAFIGGVQIGVSQGRMRTGAYGGAMRRTYGVLGDDVNLAARLMQAAASGQILVSKAAHQAAANAFVWESLPDMRVKGKAEPVSVFRLIEQRERRPIHLHGPQYALPMVGREEQLALVEQKMARALQGRGQIVAIAGEAGIGKSRLAAEAIRIARERGMTVYEGECESYGTNTSYLVWRSVWRGFFGLAAGWSPDQQVGAIAAHLARIEPGLASRLPLLSAVLNLPIDDNDLTRAFDAKLRKTSLEALLVDCVRAASREAPLLIALEDCHWLDPLSQDLLEVIGRAIADAPVLLVMAYRPPESDRQQALRVSRLPHFTEIPLTSFTPQEAERLIRLKLDRIFGSQAAPRAVVERLTARAEGNPFYIEELLNYLQDRGVDPQDNDALERLDLPTSLHSLILARVDQLSENQKTTLRVASVIGRLFKAAILWGSYPQVGDPQRVKADLDILSRLELTLIDAEPELTYLFKHIVTQEVTYESLPFATRAMLHEQIAAYLERTYQHEQAQYLDLLAFHYDRSTNEAKKRVYLLKAGEAAQAGYANAAAIDYYRRVLPLLPVEAQGPVRLKLGQVLELVGNWNGALEAYRQALELAEQRADRRAQAQCQTAIGELYRKRGQYDDAGLWLERAQAGCEAIGDEAGVGQALHYAGSVAAQRGDYPTAKALYQQSLTIRRALDDKPHIASLLSNLGIVARSQGNYPAARSLHEEGLAIRRQLGDRRAIAVSLNNLGNVALDQQDYVEARACLEEALTLQREVGDKQYIAHSLNNLGNVVRAQGDFAAARALYRESLSIVHEIGDLWALAYLLEDVGCLAALEGQPERALRLIGAASGLRESIGAPLSSVEQSKLERALEPARQALSGSAQAAASAEGRGLSLQQAIDYALTERLPVPA
jgi:predicted ATPase/class 3 adenylate cyclase